MFTRKTAVAALAALAASITLMGAAADGFARERHVNGTGAAGRSYSRNLDSGCTDGTCSRTRDGVTRGGNSWNSSRSATKNSDGTYSTQGSAQGPNGATYSGGGSTNGNGSYSYSGTATAPSGKSVTVDKSVTVTPAN